MRWHVGAWVSTACLVWFAGWPNAHALSSSEQVNLAGKGEFAKLADGLGAKARTGPLTVSEYHAWCYSLQQIKDYAGLEACLTAFEKSLASRDRRTRLFGLDDATPTLHTMRAELELEYANPQAAAKHAQTAIDWLTRERATEADSWLNAQAALAIAHQQRGDVQRAATLLDAMKARKVGLLSEIEASSRAMALARVCAALGRWACVLESVAADKTFAARMALDNFLTGAALRGQSNWVWIELPRNLLVARAERELGKSADAKKRLDSMLASPQIAQNSGVHWVALAERAQIACAELDDKLCELHLLSAARVVERQRASINTEVNKIGFVTSKASVYGQLLQVQVKLGKAAESFETVERARSRALVDLLASKTSFAVPKSATVRGQNTGAAPRPGPAARAKSFERLRSLEVEQLRQTPLSNERNSRNLVVESARAEVLTELEPEVRALVTVQTLDAAVLRAETPQQEALLSYFEYAGMLYTHVVRQDQVFVKTADSAGFAQAMQVLRKAMEQQDPVDAQLTQWHARLIAPVQELISGRNLAIIPHGYLHALPFASLQANGRALADQHALRMVPSANALRLMRAPRTAAAPKALIVANPELGDPKHDLPGAELEADRIRPLFRDATVLRRQAASKANFLQSAADASHIHFASHGSFNLASPLLSGLHLSGRDLTAGMLTVADLYDVQLDAELVTLSACDTGLGYAAAGDELLGLVRGFLFSGASSVVASLWKVDDEATAFMMGNFYAQLPTRGVADGLREAQRLTRQKYPHPYFWASFYAVGR